MCLIMKAMVHYTVYNPSVSTWQEAKSDRFRFEGVTANMLICASQQRGEKENQTNILILNELVFLTYKSQKWA